MGRRALVAVRRAADYEADAVRCAIAGVIEAFGGWSRLVRSGDRVLVKPNCIAGAPPERPVQTHPAVILEVCRQLLDHGTRPFVGDSPAWGSLEGNLDRLGVLGELHRLGVPVVPFARSRSAGVVHVGRRLRLRLDEAALEADAIVNLPKFKAHGQLLLTVALKNTFGCVNGRRKALLHVTCGDRRNDFGRMLVETFRRLRPAITIVDAIVAMEGRGPIGGRPRRLGLIFGGTDGPAVERIAAELVAVDPDELRTLRAARDMGFGTTDLADIDIDGPPLQEIRVDDFELPVLMPIGFSVPRLITGTIRQFLHLRRRRSA